MRTTLDRLTRVTVVLLISSHRASAWSSPAAHGTAAPATHRAMASMKQGGNVDKSGYQTGGGPLQYLPPNMGGQRVIKKQVKSNREARASPGGDATSEIARRGFLGLAGLSATAYFSVISRSERVEKDEVDPFGDAVTAPTLELDLEELLDVSKAGGKQPPNAQVLELVKQLEETGGPQFAASVQQGKWVLPWVGGWERTWTSQADSSTFGGPVRTTVGRGGANQLTLEGVRHFIYGPGAGGITIEYLYSAAASATKVLLARQGVVSNLGGNFFQLDFPSKLDGYEVAQEFGRDFLTPLPALPPGEGGPPILGVTLQTTYLSSEMWILRSYSAEGYDKVPQQICVFRRTETRSVLDRRGLVADGQLKPPDDDGIRFGKLLFGETLSDYAGWSDAAGGTEAATKDKLLGR